AMNIQTLRQIKNSPYSLIFGQNPLHHFSLLKEIKEQQIVESLLGAAALNKQQLLKQITEEANETRDREMNEIVNVNKEMDNIVDKRVNKE
ncbi:3724_t:CDS:2, partial [Racocetra persica]